MNLEATPPDDSLSASDGGAFYSLEVVAALAGEDLAGVLRYCELGLIAGAAGGEVAGAEGVFDDESLRQLRQLGYLRECCGMNEAGLQLVSGLLREVESLRRELRWR